MGKFTITLTINKKLKTYKISEEMYLLLSDRLAPYRSYSKKSMPIRCIETGKIYNNARQVASWLYDNFDDITSNILGIEAKIKRVCKGQKGGAYGYNWEFVNEEDKLTNYELSKRHWKYYANLKNLNHARSYKISEELCLNLSKELEPFCISQGHKMPVKCVETGKIFVSADSAARWLHS